VDGELTGIEMLEVRRHVRDCANCTEELESVRSIKLLVSRLGTVQPTEGFKAALSARLDEVQIPVYQRVWNSLVRSTRVRPAPVKTAFVGVAVALAVLSVKSIDQVEPGNNLASLQPPVSSGVEHFQADITSAKMQENWNMRGAVAYREPMPVSAPEGSFLMVSFGP
jgi:anti-sigma factor RsiW